MAGYLRLYSYAYYLQHFYLFRLLKLTAMKIFLTLNDTIPQIHQFEYFFILKWQEMTFKLLSIRHIALLKQYTYLSSSNHLTFTFIMSLLSPLVCHTSRALRVIFTINLLIMCYSVDCRAQVSGTVFYDFDANGIQTHLSPAEAGVAAVGIRIFVNDNSQPLVTQTDTAGHYAFTSQQVPIGSAVRVEFFNLPETFSANLTGPHNGTEVQFVRAPASNVNLGIFNEDEFCSDVNAVKIVTACYSMGDPLKNGSAGDDPALVLFDYGANGEGGTSLGSPMEKLANASAIGSTWIASYQRSSNTLLLGAITRRHVGLGPLGTGGFYAINLKSRTVSNFIDVKTIGIDTGPDPT